jgi:glycine cleavage system H protein
MLYSGNHIWLSQAAETVRLGISEYAQAELGHIVFLSLPNLGDTLVKGKKFGDVESVKKVSDLISPVDGIVTAINEALSEAPDLINAEPYKSWLIEANVKKLPDGLMSDSEYKEYIK